MAPLNIPNDNPTSFPEPNFITLDNFKRGVITLIDKSRLPKNALEEADNIFLYEDGQPGPRPGVDWFGTAPTYYSTGTASQSGLTVTGIGTTFTSSMVGMTITFSTGETAVITAFTDTTHVTVGTSQTVSATTYTITASVDGFDYFDSEGTINLVLAAGGIIYRSLNDGTTWTACSGATYTAGNKVNMNQYNAYLYLTNGVDNIIRYDGSTTLVAYSTLATPTAPSVAESAGLAAVTGSAYTYSYRLARVNSIGFSIRSDVSTGTVSSNLARSSWDSTTNYVTLTTPVGVANQDRWEIYISEDGSNYYYLSSTPATNGATSTWVDDGTAIVVPNNTAPTASTAQGPLVQELVNVGSRMYGIRDTVNRHRIWFTSGTPPYGSFSSSYDGGYLEWDFGGKYVPVAVADYRDGKGTPLATVWCKSADGQGCIIQMSLDLFTVGDISITVPSAYKLPGSRGTPAPGSVVNVLNDFMFYNTQAFYNLGSRVNFQNLLSTDEASANIRPTVKQISTAGEANIASVYFDAKVYFSVPYGSSTNNYTAVYDTERKAWLPTAFTLGFKKFLRYTDTTGSQRLLCLKPGDTRLSEISTSVLGDYGVAFNTSLLTGLYPTVPRNRFDFQNIEEAQMEFSQPQGTINIELIGIERSQGFSTIGTETINPTLTDTGWDTFLWDSTAWDDTSVVIDTFSESSVKKYFPVLKELNAFQWRITTSSTDASYVLRTLQIWGTNTQAGMPRDWRL